MNSHIQFLQDKIAADAATTDTKEVGALLENIRALPEPGIGNISFRAWKYANEAADAIESLTAQVAELQGRLAEAQSTRAMFDYVVNQLAYSDDPLTECDGCETEVAVISAIDNAMKERS